MSSTELDDKSSNELMPVASNTNVIRMANGAIDDQYIYEYINDPRSKINALRKAVKVTGIDCHVSRSRAFDIHKRLSHRIEQAVTEMSMEGATLGFSILIDMACNSESDQVKVVAAKSLIEYAGKNKPSEQINARSRDNLKEQIEQTKARILSITGNKAL